MKSIAIIWYTGRQPTG